MNLELPVTFTARARRQINEADEWWIEHRPSAPFAVEEEVTRIASLISAHPEVGVRVVNVRLRGVRKVHAERVHYDLYYRLLGSPPHTVEILAFWSAWRGSRPTI